MTQLNVQIDPGDLMRAKLMLSGIKNAVPKVSMRAINKTLTGIRTDAVEEISNIITPTKTVIRNTFTIVKATSSKPSALVKSTGYPLGLVYYGASKTTKGVSVQVKRSGERTLFPHAFFTVVGHTAKGVAKKQVFSRIYKGARTKAKPTAAWKAMPKKYRLPVKKLAGPRVADIFSNNAVFDAVSKKAWPRLKKNFNHEIDYELSRHK